MKSFYYFLVFFSLSTTQFSFGQANFESRNKEVIARNKVKKQIQWSYDYIDGKPGSMGYKSLVDSFDLKGNLVKEMNYKNDGTVTSVIAYTYDYMGNKTSYIRYKGNKEKVTYRQDISYDKKGNKLSETGFDGVSTFENTFKYDANNKLIEIKYTTDKVLSEKRAIKYEGNTTTMLINNATNSTLSREITTYDTKKNIIQEEKYIQDNITQKSNYTYDSNGNKIEETKQNFGNFDHRLKYYYDNKGNTIKITEEKPAGKIYIAYEYKYDVQGNVIEERWAKDNSNNYSIKSHIYNAKNLLQSSNVYLASYNFHVLNKFTFEFY